MASTADNNNDVLSIFPISFFLEDVLPRIDHVLALDCINFFIAFLNMSDCPDLQVQLEFIWICLLPLPSTVLS